MYKSFLKETRLSHNQYNTPILEGGLNTNYKSQNKIKEKQNKMITTWHNYQVIRDVVKEDAVKIILQNNEQQLGK